MNDCEEKIIKPNKAQAIKTIVGSCIFAAIGFFIFLTNLANGMPASAFKSLLRTSGLIVFLFCGLLALFLIYKLLSNKPALILNSCGIVDNASIALARMIPWSEIVGFTVSELNKHTILIIKVSNPEKYFIGDPLAFKTQRIKRALNKQAFDQFGSPIVINFKGLQIEKNELINICKHYFERYGNRPSTF